MSLGNLINVKNGLVEIGGVEVPNVKKWSRSQSGNSSDHTFLNVTNSVSIGGVPTVTGTIDFVFDPDDATHLIIQAGGQVTANFYLNGNDTGKKYYSGDVLLDGFDIDIDSADGSAVSSCPWKSAGPNTLLTVA